jgi:hypothetical protein
MSDQRETGSEPVVFTMNDENAGSQVRPLDLPFTTSENYL